MNETPVRRMQGERGASLILAIAFMVVVGAISAAVISTAASGLQDRVALDSARNREYAADSAIETMIATARAPALGASGVCPPAQNFSTASQGSNGVAIHVDCNPSPQVIGSGGNLLTQENLVFTACDGTVTCTTNTIINAQVNFRGSSPVKTFIQAWSVNR